MKKVYIITLTILFSSTVFAQEVADKGYIAFSIGPSFPTGNYASTDLDNNDAGFANTGAIFDFSFAYRLGKNFGIAAILRGLSNPFDEAAFIAGAINEAPGISWSVNADPWSLGGIMFGAYGSFPIGNGKTAFETRLMFGFMNATLPQRSITGSALGLSYSALGESKSAGGPAVMLGGNFRFHLGKKVSLITAFDVFACNAEFQNVKTEYSDGTSDYDTFTQNFSSVNLSVGIAYRLGTTVALKN